MARKINSTNKLTSKNRLYEMSLIQINQAMNTFREILLEDELTTRQKTEILELAKQMKAVLDQENLRKEKGYK